MIQDAFRWIGSVRRLGQWITLLINGFCLAPVCRGADACPPDALAPGVQISVVTYRQDGITPIGFGFVASGETIVLRSSICYVPFDPFTESSLSAVEQGKLTITLKGVSHDVTPPAGIPLVGTFCEGVAVVQSTNAAYVVTEADALAGAIVIRADYTDGIAHLSPPVPVHVFAHVNVRVRPTLPAAAASGPLRIQKVADGRIWLSFTGQPQKTYRIEATTDFAQWTPVGTIAPDSAGLCQAEDVEAHAYSHRFYRYVMEN